MPINIDGIAVDPDAAQPLGRLLADRRRSSRRSRPACRRPSLPPYNDPDAVARRRLADRAARHRHRRARAVLRRGRSEHQRAATARDLIIRPLARLHEQARTTSSRSATRVKAADGSDAARCPPRSPRCATARASTTRGSPRSSARYADIFAALATAGVDKTELVLAWDFVTASDEFLHGRPDDDARRRAARDGHERREPDVHRDARSRTTHDLRELHRHVQVAGLPDRRRER